MAVTKVKLVHSSGGEDAQSVKYQLIYLVTTDNRNDGPAVVRASVPFVYGSPYVNGNDDDPRAVALSISEQPVSGAHFHDWTVTVDFGVPPDGETPNVHPILDPVEITVTWNGDTKKINQDPDGNPLLNTAYDIYEEPIEVTDNQPVITYSLNQVVFPFATAQFCRNATNSTAWKGFPAATVKVESMSSTRKFHKTWGYYYSVTYTFKIDPDNFRRKLVSVGYRELVTGPPTVKRKFILDPGTNLPIAAPQLLDVSGLATTTPYIQEKTVYPELNFNTLFGFL